MDPDIADTAPDDSVLMLERLLRTISPRDEILISPERSPLLVKVPISELDSVKLPTEMLIGPEAPRTDDVPPDATNGSEAPRDVPPDPTDDEFNTIGPEL